MEEKYMVNDILENTKAGIKDYEGAILECANMELRQTVQNIRNSSEPAKPDEIAKVHNECM